MKTLLKLIIVITTIVILFYIYGTGNYRDGNYYPITVNNVEPVETSDTLSIMTFNIGWLSGMTNNLPVERSKELYKVNLHHTVDVLKKNRNNIIAFQEIDIFADRSFNCNQVDSVSILAGYKYIGLAVNWDKMYVPFPGINPKYFFGTVVSAQCIFSDLEVLENTAEKLIKPMNAPFYYNAFYLDRLIQKTLIKTDKGNIMVLNVHLEAYDEETRNNHIDRTIEVFNEYRKKMPTLLVGDFNSPQWSDVGRNKNLNRLFEMENVANAIPDSIYKKDVIGYNTFSTEDPSEKIDFIFYNTDKIKAIDTGVLQEIGSPSDHFPVWMTFVVK